MAVRKRGTPVGADGPENVIKPASSAGEGTGKIEQDSASAARIQPTPESVPGGDGQELPPPLRHLGIPLDVMGALEVLGEQLQREKQEGQAARREQKSESAETNQGTSPNEEEATKDKQERKPPLVARVLPWVLLSVVVIAVLTGLGVVIASLITWNPYTLFCGMSLLSASSVGAMWTLSKFFPSDD